MKAKNVFQYVLGAVIVIGFFLLLYFLLWITIPADNKDLLNITVGALIGSFTSIVGYFYGSSLGSAEKNDLLKNGNKP
jgi:drug/metabolite transporter (DMT)-like permease